MNRLVVSLVLSAFALGANAQSQTPDAARQSSDNATDVTVVSGAEARLADRNCLHETGSHLVNKGKKACINAIGVSYSRADIERTGSMDLADALRHLDPGITVSHH
jgi:hypothetical protein